MKAIEPFPSFYNYVRILFNKNVQISRGKQMVYLLPYIYQVLCLPEQMTRTEYNEWLL